MRNFYAFALLFLSLLVNAQNVTFTASEFKNILVNSICADTNDDGILDSDVDTNNDGQIQTTEAQAVYHLNTLGLYAKNLSGIDAFTHLKSLVCAGSGLLFINISGLNQLQSIDCSGAGTYSITLNGLTQLETLNCSNNELMTVLNFSGLDQLKNLNCSQGRITNLNLTPHPLLETLNCSGNQLSTITFPVSNNLQSLNCSKNLLANFDYAVVPNLKILNCSQTQSTSLQISALTQLEELYCSRNQLTSIPLASLPALVQLECSSNSISSLDLSLAPQLKILNCAFNLLTALPLSQSVNLEILNCDKNQITSLDTSGLLNLKSLSCNKNGMNALTIHQSILLEDVSCYENNLAALDASNLTLLKSLTCQKNQLATLTLANMSSLKTLNCSINHLIAVDLGSLISVETIDCSQNNLSAINTSNLSQIKTLNCNNNHLTVVDTTAMTNLETLQCGSNELTALTIINLPNLKNLNCSNNQIAAMDFGTSSNLYKIELVGNLFTTLDFSELQANGKSFRYNLANNPNLTYVNVKNGCSLRRYSYQDTTGFYASDCPNIQFVCADDDNLSRISVNPLAVVSSYCSFVPGGAYNTVTGTLTLDLDNNGCNLNDPLMRHTKVTLDESTVGGMSGATFTDENGTYKFYTRTGLFNLTPIFENPYFITTPASAQIDFPALDGSTQTQNFCISPNGIHNDVELTVLPGLLRPGFDSTFTLAYKNKGNQIMSGNITFSYDDATHDLISSDTAIDSQNQNSLSWNYNQLMPFETRYIHVTFNLNSPQETPAVNAGDMLYYTASITPVSADETPLDNVFELTQMVRGSYDPNDKTCLEGNTVTPEMVGKYLHYLIRFQNKGTAAAENIVVQDLIDETKFDLSSLQLTGSSHPQTTKITDNKVEFQFQNINLPSEEENEPASHGYIAFKIKTRNDLVLGDVIENKANIYFDYNYPVETNTTSATVAPLLHISSFDNNSVAVWPNPVKDVVRINAQAHINLVELLDIQGRILDSLTTNQTQVHFNLNQKSSGIYFVKIYTTQGIKVQKIIKE